MEKYRWEDSEKRRRKKIKKEKVWEERRSRCAKGRKAAKHCVFPVICGSGGLKSRLAKAAGAEPAGQMRDESCTPLWREALLEVAMSKKCTPLWHEAHVEVKMHISKSKCTKHHMFAPLLDVQMPLRVAAAWDYAPWQKWAKREGFVAFPKMMAGLGQLKRICKDAFSVAGAEQETCYMFIRDVRGPGADFLRGVFVWPGITFSWQAQYFRQVEWKNRKTHWYEAVSSALSFPFLKEVSPNCFVFDVVNFENWRRLAGLLRFWCGQLEKLKKSRRLASFLTLSSSKVEEVS